MRTQEWLQNPIYTLYKYAIRRYTDFRFPDRFVLVDQHKKAASGWGSALNSWALPSQQPGYIWQYTGLIDSSSTAISEPTTIQAENRKPGLWPDPPGLAARRAEPIFDSRLGSSVVLI